jgi:glycosyltransferase involved in cell wall biosynthesis
LIRRAYVLVLPWDVHYAGGVNQVVLNLHRQLLLAGEFEPLILINDWAYPRPVEKMVDGRRTVYLRIAPPWTGERPAAAFLKWLFFSPVWLSDLLGICRRYRVAAFNVHYPSTSAFPIALLRSLGLVRSDLILSFHGADLITARKASPPERRLWRFVLRHATAIVACSKAFAAEVQEFAGSAVRFVQAIPNGLDVDHFLAEREAGASLPGIPIDRPFILSVATWDPRKGLDVLLRAFADIRRAHPGLALVLVGREGGAESALRALAGELALEPDVVFVDSVPHAQVGAFLERATVFCLASRSETFGISILEAGAYSLPVVATRVGGIPEIIADGETGLLVNPDDPRALGAALHRLLSDETLARDLGRRLARRVADEFTWRRAYDAYRALVASP